MRIIEKGMETYQRLGIKGMVAAFAKKGQIKDKDYLKWYENNKPTEKVLKRQMEESFTYSPLISIVVPVYNTPQPFLEDMIRSVVNQSYRKWELCIANANPFNKDIQNILCQYKKLDKRIKTTNVPENLGIAQNTNAAISIASGEYIGLLDHDDLISPDALYEVVKCLNERNRPEVIYSDEDKITMDGKKHYQPNFKSEFNLDMLRSNNYICHFLVIKKSLLEDVGGVCEKYNGAQDHDLIFRCAEKAKQIVRIPKVLYHWRMHPGSTSDNPESKRYAYLAGIRAIEAHLERCGENGTVEMAEKPGYYRVKYKVDMKPLVSVVVANSHQRKISGNVLEKIVNTYDKRKVEILIVSNEEERPRYEYLKEIGINIEFIFEENDIELCKLDKGVKNARGEYVLLLSSYIEKVGENYLFELTSNIMRSQVGIVSGKLYYHNSTIKNAGMIVGKNGTIEYLFEGLPKGCNGYMNRQSMQQNVSLVSLEDTMIRKHLWEMLGVSQFSTQTMLMLEEWCNKVRKMGYLIVYTPYAEAYSNKKNVQDCVEPMKEFNYNPNLKEKFSLKT